MKLKCPSCNRELEKVTAYYTEEVKYPLTITEGVLGMGILFGEAEVVEGSEQKVAVECPKCHDTLYQSEKTSVHYLERGLRQYVVSKETS